MAQSRCIVVCAIGLLIAGCQPICEKQHFGHHCSTSMLDLSDTFMSVYITPYPSSPEYCLRQPRVIVAMFADGRVIWSRDWINGGPPYFEGRVKEEILREFAAVLRARRILGNEAIKQSYIVMGRDFTVIEVFEGDASLVLESVHEILAHSDLVATGQGIEALGDRTREEVLAQQPDKYRLFRTEWDFIKKRAEAMLPASERECKELEVTR